MSCFPQFTMRRLRLSELLPVVTETVTAEARIPFQIVWLQSSPLPLSPAVLPNPPTSCPQLLGGDTFMGLPFMSDVTLLTMVAKLWL